MKSLYIYIGLLLISFSACTKENGEEVKQTLPGGKGGKFNIAIFPESSKVGLQGKVYIRYGSKEISGSKKDYNDSSATMVEPGFTHHAHFFSLKSGFYAIKAECYKNGNLLVGDTLIEIKEDQEPSVDYSLNVK